MDIALYILQILIADMIIVSRRSSLLIILGGFNPVFEGIPSIYCMGSSTVGMYFSISMLAHSCRWLSLPCCRESWTYVLNFGSVGNLPRRRVNPSNPSVIYWIKRGNFCHFRLLLQRCVSTYLYVKLYVHYSLTMSSSLNLFCTGEAAVDPMASTQR